jgi:uncharacterized protein YciI
MQFLVFLRDAIDPQTPKRRAATRPLHLARAEQFQHRGCLVMGGALLDEDGNAIGSAAFVQFENRAELDEWFNTDPYRINNVWASMEVHDFRIAPHYKVKPLLKETT